jgi:putative toxin-antitoxin system antitoxin component (TIGR02293 family)
MSQTLIRKQKGASGGSSAVRGTGRNSSGSSLGLRSGHTKELIQKLEKGLPFNAIEILSRTSGIHASELASVMALPERTFARRKSAGRFAPEESERLLRIARIFELAVELFAGDVRGAVKWLETPRKALGNHTPLKYSATEIGAREVENLIGQLVHGVFP